MGLRWIDDDDPYDPIEDASEKELQEIADRVLGPIEVNEEREEEAAITPRRSGRSCSRGAQMHTPLR